MLSKFEAENLKALETLKREHHVQVLQFPDDVLHGLHKLAGEALDEEAAKDEGFRKVYEAYKAFSANNAAWSEISESAYAAALKK